MNYKYKLLIREFPLDQVVFIEDEINPIILILKQDGDSHSAKILSANCPHQGGPLSKGEIEGGYISCPWHGCKFDIKTGKGLSKLSLIELDSLVDGEYLYVF